MTWPLARDLKRDVASDLGDSLYYMWAIAWNCKQFLAILGGDLARIRSFFDANIFHPEPLGLVYSDHMVAQAAQALPLFVLSGNLILCYNVLFLSTFVLCGLGTYLFVRELTGSARAAFVAGLLFAFAPYRLGHSEHLNLLSVQWTPLALYGLRRYFDTGRRLPLAGAATALVAQNLSSGYYLVYFMPFVAAYALWEVAVRRAWPSRRMWLELTAAAIIVGGATAPFVIPYLLLRDRLPALRDLREVSQHSADVYGYLTAPPGLRLWGDMLRTYPRSEGDLFPGLLPVALAVVGILAWAKRSMTGATRTAGTAGGTGAEGPRGRERLARVFLVVSFGYLLLATVVIYQRRLAIELGPMTASANDVTRLLTFAAGALIITLTLSGRARSVAARMARAPEAWALALLVAAWWLSLGPAPTALGRPLDLLAPYAFLYEYVPGFAGARVPARYAMLVAFALAVLAGFGLRAIDRRRWGTPALIAAGLGFLVEVSVLPYPVNRVRPVENLATPEARVHLAASAPAVYTAVRRLPERAVLVELPLGRPEYDVRAMYYSTMHWRPLINGYSGFYPPDYPTLMFFLSDIPGRPERAWQALRRRGVTHALVHEAAYLEGEGTRISASFRAAGAAEIFSDGSDTLFALPAGRRFRRPAARIEDPQIRDRPGVRAGQRSELEPFSRSRQRLAFQPEWRLFGTTGRYPTVSTALDDDGAQQQAPGRRMLEQGGDELAMVIEGSGSADQRHDAVGPGELE